VRWTIILTEKALEELHHSENGDNVSLQPDDVTPHSQTSSQ